MATLTNTKIKDTYDGLLKTTDNDVIGASEKVITDGLGNASVLSIGTASASFSSDIQVNGLTIGKGANDVSTNTALGYQTLENTTGAGNTALGYASLLDNTTGVNNTAVGLNSLRYNITGGNNTAIGIHSLTNNTASNNTAIGSYALDSNTTGGSNVAVGQDALNSNTTGSNITAVGRASMSNATAGNNNTALGFYSLVDNQASNNVAVGDLALRYNTTGGANTALGSNALRDNTTGVSNTALGKDSLSQNTTGGYNTSIGADALEDNTTGSFNTAVGFNALDSNTEGSNNIAIGVSALDGNTTGDKNVAVGSQALSTQTTGSFSTAVGYEALWSQTTGSNNTAIGYASMRTSTTGTYNVAVGVASLYDNTTGSNNVAIGRYALTNSISGDANIGIGTNSGNQLTTGSNNIYIGNTAVGSAANNDNEIVIGASATGNGSNTATYGNASITGHHFTAGQVNVTGNLAADSNILVGGNQSILAENNLRFKSAGASYIDHNTVGQSINFRVSSASSLDTTAMTISSNGSLAVDTNTLYVDASNNRVGIGTASPSASLSIDKTGVNQHRALDLENDSITYSMYIDQDNVGTDSWSLFDTTNSQTALRYLPSASGYWQFYTNGSEKMRIDSSGNVGIGTNSPTSAGSGRSVLHLNGASGTGITFSKTGQANSYIYTSEADHEALTYYVDGEHLFYTAGSERMRIDSSGNVGIGGTLANTKFYVTDAYTQLILGFNNSSTNYYDADTQVFRKRAGSESMRIDSSGNIQMGTGAVNSNNYSFRISAGTSGLSRIIAADTSDAGYIDYDHSSDSWIHRTAGTERMRITSGGFFKASNNGTYNSSTGTYHELKSDVAGVTLYAYNTNASSDGIFCRVDASNTSNWVFKGYAGGADRIIIYSNGNIVNDNNSYGAISDVKLKENIVDASPKLDDLMQVKIRNYNLIGDDKKQIGVVAQELESVFPSMIDESPDFEEQEVIDEEGNVTKERVDLGTTTKSVKYSVFVPMLIKAMQEQQEIINDLKARIETLEAK